MSKIIILLSGFAKSGKDTFADYLVANHFFKKISIAEKLKNDVSVKYNIPLSLLNSQKGKETCIDSKNTIRDVLIKEAAEQRSLCQNVYINNAITQIKNCYKHKIVIADTRYINEIEMIKSHFNTYKILVVRVNRDDNSPVSDVSETQLDNYKFDYVINNFSSKEIFYMKIENFIKISL